MLMVNRKGLLVGYFLIFTLSSCGFGEDKAASDNHVYTGCYNGDSIQVLVSENYISTKDGSFVYKVIYQKAGYVVSTNFRLTNHRSKGIYFNPSAYERFYPINKYSIIITDSLGYVHNLKKTNIGVCAKIS